MQRALFGAAMLAIVCLSGAVTAQESNTSQTDQQRDDDSTAQRVISDDDFDLLWQTVQQLDADDYHARRQAADMLVEADIDNALLESFLYQSGHSGTNPYALSPQQKHELLNVLTRRILEAPAGAIGISMNRNFRSAVLVERVFVDMPAGDVLIQGDRIVALNGEPVWNSEMFSELLRDFGPGDTVTLEFERQVTDPDNPNLPRMETHIVDITLAAADRLGEEHMQIVAQRRAMRVAMLVDGALIESISLNVPSPFGPVERNPVLESLVRQVEMLRQGDLGQDEIDSLERLWMREIDDLRRWFNEPGISVEEQQYRREVLNRYSEIVTDALRDDD